MYKKEKVRKSGVRLLIIVVVSLCFIVFGTGGVFYENDDSESPPKKDFIKWVDLKADGKSLKEVLAFCKACRGENSGLTVIPSYTETLAYLATKNGNNFSSYKTTTTNLYKLKEQLKEGKSIRDIYGENKYYKTHLESYEAIFGGLVGEYHEGDIENASYGIMGFFPFAEGFWHNHYNDFGSSRSYGFSRKHLGHDLFGSVGTPIVAIEGGTITELGWNQYGGWRIGIKSVCQKRYYYYAHLRKDRPFAPSLAIGDTITAGQVIGYLGNTGYSKKENVNLKTGKPHLHLGLQLIFDPSQEEGNGEIWIDLYGLSQFLHSSKAKVVKCEETKEWISESLKYPNVNKL
ncbi:MAG: M23 family metallopeptidase [Firmicutes bacterium]|nr:M23 family metallopeptidase [Bacillota bacterium]